MARLRKAQQRLQAIQQSVQKARRQPTVAALTQRAAQAVAQAGPPIGQWVTSRVEGDDAHPVLTYAIDHEAFHRWGEQHWGKTILFTDHDDWSTEAIITAYREAWHVESTFRDLKHPLWIHWQPQFHWTDDKIRVHGLICVLAVTLAHLLRRECAQAGVDLSLPALLQELTTIREVAWLFPSHCGTKPCLTLTKRTAQQQQLMDLLSIPLPTAQ